MPPWGPFFRIIAMPLPDSFLPDQTTNLWDHIEAKLPPSTTWYSFKGEIARLQEMVKSRVKVSLNVINRTPGLPGQNVDVLRAVLSTVPDRLFLWQRFRTIHLNRRLSVTGGTGILGSAYVQEEGAVYLFPEIFDEGMRIYTALATHELGHALLQQYLLDCDRLRYQCLKVGWEKLRQSGAFLGIAMGGIGDRAARIEYQSGEYHEFLAEVFMQYVLFKADLRAHVASFGQGPAKQGWDIVMTGLAGLLDPRH